MSTDEVVKIIKLLKKTYPDAKCSLNFETPFELAIAVMLSAQCTDERVNKTTPKLFERCKTIQDFANIDITELESIIHPCGFYKNKAKNIKLCATQVLENFNGEVPRTMNELLSLAGVGRKSANVIMLEAFNTPVGIAVDTHVTRITRKMGISNKDSQEKIEMELMKKLPKYYWNKINHILVNHGRKYCIAKKPDCINCPINNLCPKND